MSLINLQVMMNMKDIFKYAILLLASGGGLCLHSCEDTYPSAADSAYPVDLTAIRIVNAGADGQTVLEGAIDEDNKIVNFKRIDPATDFSGLRFEATLSEGAVLEKDVLDFSMQEGESEKTLILRVRNHNRYKDYFVRVRQKVPVFGADWDKATVYNFSGDHIYEECLTASTRWADCDGEYVLVVSRVGGLNPHLLRVADLMQGKIEPVALSTDGISGGTFPISCGALINGHVYINSLCGGGISPLKVYYWDTPESTPEVILENILSTDVPEADARHGDNASYNIDKKGNGYIHFGSNADGRDILRYTVTDHKTIGFPQVLPSRVGAQGYMTINRIEDGDEYLWSGVYMAPALTNASASIVYDIKTLNGTEFTACRAFSFNGERYLLACSAARSNKVTPTMFLYDITRGDTVADALAIFEAGERKPVYQFVLGGTNNANPGTSVNYSIQKDEEGKDMILRVFAHRTQSGFVIVDFPIKVASDD